MRPLDERVKLVPVIQLDGNSGVEDERNWAIRRAPYYDKAKPNIQIRISDTTFITVNAHALYDALWELIAEKSTEELKALNDPFVEGLRKEGML